MRALFDLGRVSWSHIKCTVIASGSVKACGDELLDNDLARPEQRINS